MCQDQRIRYIRTRDWKKELPVSRVTARLLGSGKTKNIFS